MIWVVIAFGTLTLLMFGVIGWILNELLDSVLLLMEREIEAQKVKEVHKKVTPRMTNPQLYHHPLAPPEVINPDRPHLRINHEYVDAHTN